MLKIIALDWGGVLIHNPASDLKKYCADYFGIEFSKLEIEIDKNIEAFQNGISEFEFWNRCGILNVREAVWNKAADEVFRLNEVVAASINEFKSAGLKLAFLSNTEISAYPILEKRSWAKWFDFFVVSCLLKQLKPHQEIYRSLLEITNCTSDEILFIDDRQDNVDGARLCGIAAWRYSSDEEYIDLCERLRKVSYAQSELEDLF